MVSVADVYVDVRGRTTALAEDARKGGAKAGEEAGRGFHSGFTSVLKGLAAGTAALGIFQFVQSAISASQDAARVMRITDAVLKSTHDASGETAESIHSLAERLGEMSGTMPDVIQGGENMLATFTEIKGPVFEDATKAIVDMTAAMNHGAVTADGLQAATIQVGKALNDPIKGYTALKRVGVTFTDEQRKQIVNFVKHNQLARAQGVILTELKKEFGGTAAAATDPMRKATVQWQEFKEKAGTELIPVLGKVLGIMLSFIPTVETIVKWVVNFTAHNKVLVSVLGGLAAAVWLVNIAMSANPITVVIVGLTALVVAIVYAWQHFQTFRNIVRTVWRDVSHDVDVFVAFFTKTIPSAFNAVVSFVSGIPRRILGYFSDIGSWFVGVGEDIIRGIMHGVENLAGSLADSVKNAASNALNSVKSFLGISSPSKVFAEIGRQTMEGYIAGVTGQLGNVAQATRRAVGPSVATGVAAAGGGGLHVENVNVRAFSDRFSLRQVMDELAMQGAH